MVEATRLTEPELENLIRSLTGSNEDTYQDIWLAVLEHKAFSQEEVTRIAQEVKERNRKVYNRSAFAERSLSAPIGQDKEDDLTLESLLPDTYVDEQPQGADAPTRFMGHRGYKNIVGLDAETAKILRTRYPDWPLGDAIRLMVGLEPLNKRRAWQPWEDNIIKERYPFGGSFACQTDLTTRTCKQINQRAKCLHVQVKDRVIRGHEQWLTISEVAAKTGSNKDHIFDMVHGGFLEVIPMPRGKQKHFLFSEQMVAKFLHDYPFKYKHESLDGFKKYAPKWLFDWVTPCVATTSVPLSINSIKSYASHGVIPSRHGIHNRVYVRIGDIESFLKNRIAQPKKQPFKSRHSNIDKRHRRQMKAKRKAQKCKSLGFR